MVIEDLIGRKNHVADKDEDTRNQSLKITGKKVNWQSQAHRQFIKEVIKSCSTLKEVAQILGLSYHTVHYALNRYFKYESQKFRR